MLLRRRRRRPFWLVQCGILAPYENPTVEAPYRQTVEINVNTVAVVGYRCDADLEPTDTLTFPLHRVCEKRRCLLLSHVRLRVRQVPFITTLGARRKVNILVCGFGADGRFIQLVGGNSIVKFPMAQPSQRIPKCRRNVRMFERPSQETDPG